MGKGFRDTGFQARLREGRGTTAGRIGDPRAGAAINSSAQNVKKRTGDQTELRSRINRSDTRTASARELLKILLQRAVGLLRARQISILQGLTELREKLRQRRRRVLA